MENSLTVGNIAEHKTSDNDFSPRYISKKVVHVCTKNIYENIHRPTIHNSPKLESSKMPNCGIDEQITGMLIQRNDLWE